METEGGENVQSRISGSSHKVPAKVHPKGEGFTWEGKGSTLGAIGL